MEVNTESVLYIDESSFDALFERFYPALCAFTAGWVGDGDAARDVVQDAFAALWEARRGFRSETAVRAYLYRVCRNSAVDMLRRQKTRSDYRSDPGGEDAPETQIIVAELALRLGELIDGLPPETRRVFRMSIEGKSYKEIARELSISVNTVKNQRIRALKILHSRSGELE